MKPNEPDRRPIHVADAALVTADLTLLILATLEGGRVPVTFGMRWFGGVVGH